MAAVDRDHRAGDVVTGRCDQQQGSRRDPIGLPVRICAVTALPRLAPEKPRSTCGLSNWLQPTLTHMFSTPVMI
ncbi:MAG: hypothetical protein KGJ66_12660 [Alphaproteobacteria bacterium]|nr:hypothetical protein [Alphaproteobacteria bacterium]